MVAAVDENEEQSMNRIKSKIVSFTQNYARSYILQRCYIGGLVLLLAGKLCEGTDYVYLLMRWSYFFGAYALLGFGLAALLLRLAYAMYRKLRSNGAEE